MEPIDEDSKGGKKIVPVDVVSEGSNYKRGTKSRTGEAEDAKKRKTNVRTARKTCK